MVIGAISWVARPEPARAGEQTRSLPPAIVKFSARRFSWSLLRSAQNALMNASAPLLSLALVVLLAVPTAGQGNVGPAVPRDPIATIVDAFRSNALVAL